VPLVDSRGRIFGRLNIIDVIVIVVVALLVPVAYGAYLLFRPSTPHIDSVTRSTISKEELRIASGSMLSAKLKVRGSGFNPLLRATIGTTPALGFVFEDPTSADVILGPIPAGTYDLVLHDGVQEVARAVAAITIESPTQLAVRLVGWLIDLEPAVAEALNVESTPKPPTVTIAALGPPVPGRERIEWFGRMADVPVPNRVEREAVVDVPCDPRRLDEVCNISGVALSPPSRPIVPLHTPLGILRFAITEVLPTTRPTAATVRVRFSGASELSMITVGDRDRLLDLQRSAVVESVGSRSNASIDVTLRLGVDASRDGWRYRGQPLSPGAPFHLTTDRYAISGAVESVLANDEPSNKR
jgi:hypothetical protein